MENRAGTSSRFIWGRDSESLEKGWRLKLGPQMGGGHTKGVVTSRHGISKPPRFFSVVWGIKEGKIGLFYSPDPWTQWGWVKTVPGNNLFAHYLYPLRMRTTGHAPGLMFYREDEKGCWSALFSDYHLFFSLSVFYSLIECLTITENLDYSPYDSLSPRLYLLSPLTKNINLEFHQLRCESNCFKFFFQKFLCFKIIFILCFARTEISDILKATEICSTVRRPCRWAF